MSQKSRFCAVILGLTLGGLAFPTQSHSQQPVVTPGSDKNKPVDRSQRLAIRTSVLPAGHVRVSYKAVLRAEGGTGTLKWSVADELLPPGLVRNGTEISGTPTQPGSFAIPVEVSDSSSPEPQTAVKELVIQVTGPVMVTTGAVPGGSVGANYRTVVEAAGGVRPYSWTEASGSELPPGLALEPTTGLVSGRPTKAGTFAFTLQVADGSQSQSATKRFQATIAPVVLKLDSAVCQNKTGQPKEPCGRNDVLIVKFANLRQWREADLEKNDPEKLVLMLDGRLMGVTARAPDYNDGHVHVDLARIAAQNPADDNRAAWNALVRGLPFRSRQVTLGVALKQGDKYDTTSGIAFRVLSRFSAITGGGLLVVLLVVIFWKRDLLRDSKMPEGGDQEKRSYSLGRCQMAWWSVLVFGTFVYLWSVTGEWDVISESAWALLGISAGTLWTGLQADGRKAKELGEQTARVAELAGAQPATPAAQQAANAEKTWREQRAATLQSAHKTTGNFFKDILSEDDEVISLHRLQMFVWTILLGIIFVKSSLENVTMPNFSGSILLLMGVSSGAYVAVKAQKAEPSATK